MDNKKSEIRNNDKGLLVIAVIIASLSLIIIVFITQWNSILNLFKSDYVEPDEKGDNYVVYDGLKSNTSVEFRQPKEYGIYTIFGGMLEYENGFSKFTALVKITDENKKEAKGKVANFNFLDKEKNIICTLSVYIPDIIEGETVVVQSMVEKDIVDAYDYVIEGVDNKKE